MNIIQITIVLILNLVKYIKVEQIQASTYRLFGSTNSYAQYLAWYPCLNGTIRFEFKSHEPNGLLLYAQSLPYKYIQISLTDGNLRLRMRIGEKDNPRGVFLVHQNLKLNDEKWHQVELTRQNEKTVLKIDSEVNLYHVHIDANLEGNDLYFGSDSSTNDHTGNFLFIGGLPNSLQTYDLSLGTALFEPRFNGFIRNVNALNCSSKYLKRLNVISSNNLRFVQEKDPCMSNPCLNNGLCSVSSDSIDDFKCDCTYTNYEGKFCDILKPPKSNEELTFTGKEYFSYELPIKQEFSTAPTYEEEFNLEFKTSRSTGLLAYAGDMTDYVVFGLQDGGLYFKLNIKGQIFEKTLTIPGTFLHNNNWHSIKFSRKVKQIEIIIDNMKKDNSNLTGDFISMHTRIIYIGGVPKQNTIYRTIRKNFIGCLRNVTFKSDLASINLISLALNDSTLIHKSGKLEKSCKKLMDPVTFSSPNSYIPIYEWKDYPKLNSFSIEFQTTENHGILAYILGAENINQHQTKPLNPIQSQLLSLNRDFFSLEIHNRFLNAYFNLGTSYIRHEVVHEHVSTGKSHQISIEINDKYAIFRFDQKPETSIRIDTSEHDILELTGPLVIGGLYPNHTSPPASNPSLRIPPYFYSGMLGNGYVGCIQDVEINNQLVNLTHFAVLEGVNGINTDMCTPMPNQCDIGHCLNDGICMEGWNRFICDCSSTGFNGPICNQPATIANFADGQHIRIRFEPEWISEAEHLSLRFKTHRKQDSILLSTYSTFSKDMMEIALENTQVKLYIKIGNSEATMLSNEGLCDNRWHTVKVSREGARLILQVDNDEPATGMLTGFDLEFNNFQIHFTYLEIGSNFYNHDFNTLNNMKYKSLAYDSIDIGSKFIKHKTSGQYLLRNLNSFEGQMQQLLINGKSYFELIDNGDMINSVNRTVVFERADLPHKFPLSFHSTESWLAFPKIDAFHILLIQFHFKTTLENGLILYNNGENDDFISVELYHGQISFRFSLGKTIYKISSKSKQTLNDNKWHLVSIWRSTKTSYELSVDSILYKLNTNSQDSNHKFNLIDNLFIAGLKSQHEYELYLSKSRFMSKHGFKGCLASVEINGRVPEFDEVLTSTDKIGGNVTKGCENPFDCHSDTCKNGGICIEKWEENKKVCNCDLTTFTGKFCESKSVGYRINKGVINFEYKSPIYWQDDSLAFGLETRTKDALLFRAFNGRTNKTVILELNDGYIQALYVDLHGITHLHSFKNYRLNNKKYHIIKFNVQDFNSSLSVDGNHARKEIITDNTFNPIKKYRLLVTHIDPNQIQIDIAGVQKINIKDASFSQTYQIDLSNNFIGNIYGLVFNKHRILDLLSQNDQRVKTNGEVHLITEEDNDYERNLNKSKLDENESELISIDYNYKNQESNTKQMFSKSTLEQMSSETTTSTTQEVLSQSTNSNLATKLLNESQDVLNSNFILVLIFISALILVILIFALYKYRNRDEGTYTIDESKNYGPFAELDQPLNGTNKKSKKGSNLASKNKEWYV